MLRKVLLAALLLVAATAEAGAAGRWIHIRVKEYSDDGETVKINFPLSAIEKMLPLIDEGNFREGRIQINDRKMDAPRLRAIWAAVREVEDGEFVTVESRDENVRVARSEGFLLVNVDETRGDREHVEIKVPLTVVDALLSGEGDELNLTAAIKALDNHGPGHLITVDDEDSQVRIWVDNEQAGGGKGR
jgi:hypothetical protein